MWRPAGLLLVATVIAACDTSSAAACVAQVKPPGEVHGKFGTYIPCTFPGPACGDNDPAYRPVPGARVVFRSLECGGQTFATRTADDGTYDLTVPEGRYTVTADGGRPATVTVTSGRHLELNLVRG